MSTERESTSQRRRHSRFWTGLHPQTEPRWESFLGFTNYHRNFIRDFAGIAAPLYRLMGPKAVYQWTDECEQAFRALKDAVVSAPVLAFPNAQDPFVLDTNASDLCLGAELSQIQDGVEHMISYGSVILSPNCRRYCTTHKELLAVVLFTRQFRHYLLGRKFIARTDNHSLIWLMQFKLQKASWLVGWKNLASSMWSSSIAPDRRIPTLTAFPGFRRQSQPVYITG